jgi:sec-independent protein translocase protein TatA
MPFHIGWMELVLFLGIVLLLFGSTRLPALMRSLGQSVTEFKKGTRAGENENIDAPPSAKDAT